MRIHIKNKKNVLKKNLRKYISAAVSVAVFLCVMLFWLCVHPEWLNYHEQNQLFLFSWSYFVERLSLPGGLADWMGEFLVQFYYVPALGAAVLGLLAFVLQRTGRRQSRFCSRSGGRGNTIMRSSRHTTCPISQ